MGKFFCSDCNQSVDDVVCPICGAPTESLVFDEGSPDGRSDRYDDSIIVKLHDDDIDVDDEDEELGDDGEDEDGTPKKAKKKAKQAKSEEL